MAPLETSVSSLKADMSLVPVVFIIKLISPQVRPRCCTPSHTSGGGTIGWHGNKLYSEARLIYFGACFLSSRRTDLLGETDVDRVFDPSPPDSLSLREQDLPRIEPRTRSGAPCPAPNPGEDDLMSSQRSGVTGCGEREEDDIEEFEDEW